MNLDNSKINTSNFQIAVSIWRNISFLRKAQLSLLIIVMHLSALTESLSIGAVAPFIGVLSNPEMVWKNNLIRNFAISIGINGPDQILLPIIIIFAFSALLSGIVRSINLWLNVKLAAAVTSDLSVKAYKNTLYQEYEFHIKRNSSELISTIITETIQTSRVLNYIMLFLTSVILFIAILITLFIINYNIALIAIFSFGTSYLILAFTFKKKITHNSKLISKANKLQMKSLQEGLGSIKEVLLRSNQDVFINNYRKEEISLRQRQAQNSFIAYFPRYMMESLGLILIALISYFLIREDNNIGEVLPILGTLAIAAQRLIPTLQQIYTNWAGIRDRSAAVDCVISLAQQKTQQNYKVIPIINFKDNSRIILSNVAYSYNKKSGLILNDVSLQIYKGDKIGVIGRTGSGKTTLIELIMGLIPPDKGEVTINNQNIHKLINRKLLIQWRESISYVPQNIFLSDVSIKENIAFGLNKEDIDFNKVKNACKAVQLSGFIESKPYQYDTLVGERGINLSGGQCQRLAIARALYSDKEILILDEATSAVDNLTEKSIINEIEKNYSTKTILMIAHRLSSLSNCNKIIELDQGRVVNIYSKQWIRDNIS